MMLAGEVEMPHQERREQIMQEIATATAVANMDTERENAHTYQTSSKSSCTWQQKQTVKNKAKKTRLGTNSCM
jgi:hypothetical protein